MADSPQAKPGRPAPDEPAVQALELGRVISHARRAAARSRRLPGLAVLFLGMARGRVETAPPRLPALPWSMGLSAAWLWGAGAAHRAHGGGGEYPSAAAAMTMAGDGPRTPEGRTGDREPARDDARGPLPARTSAAGLESVAPALVLLGRGRVPSISGAHSGPGAPSPRAQGAPARAIVRAGWNLLWDVRVVRPVVGATRTFAEERAPGAGSASAGQTGLAGERTGPGGERTGPAGAAEITLPAVRGRTGGEIPVSGAGALPRSSPAPHPDVPRLVQRDLRAASIAARSGVEGVESLRTWVAREVKEQVDHVVASRQPAEPARAAAPPTDGDMRRLLSRMRVMMQDERFRSGKIR